MKAAIIHHTPTLIDAGLGVFGNVYTSTFTKEELLVCMDQSQEAATPRDYRRFLYLKVNGHTGWVSKVWVPSGTQLRAHPTAKCVITLDLSVAPGVLSVAPGVAHSDSSSDEDS